MIQSRNKAAEEKARIDESERLAVVEKMYLKDLMDSNAGRWILSQIVSDFESYIRGEKHGHNSMDSYMRGKQDYARKYRDKLVRNFGFAILDRLDLIGDVDNGK